MKNGVLCDPFVVLFVYRVKIEIPDQKLINSSQIVTATILETA